MVTNGGGMRFNKAQVERIIARAVEEDANDVETFSSEDVARIGAELGVDPATISQAIAAEVAGRHAVTRRRSLLPGEIAASRLIEGDPDEIARKAHAWMAKSEGMRIRRRQGELEIWEKDPRPLANLRAGLGLTPGGKDVRSTGPVEVVQTPVPNGVMVSMVSSGAYQRGAAAGIWSGFALGGFGGSIALTIAASQPWAWIYLFLPLLVIGTIVAIVASNAWASNVAGGMERALDGIAEGPPPVTDTVADVISDIRDTFVSKQRGTSTKRPGTKNRTIDL